MTEQRLLHSAVLSIDRDLTQQLSLDVVIDRFAGEDRSRRITLS